MMRLLTDQELDNLIVDIVARARERFGIPEGASIDEARQAVGLKLRRASIPQPGMLTNRGEIIINDGITWQPRIDFTIYHEIFHCLLDYHYPEIVEYFSEALGSNEKAYHDAIERCCNAGAAEFMLPRQQVRDVIKADGFSIERIEQLAALHGSSILATAVQVALNAPMHCYVVVCSYGRSPLPPHNVGLHVELAAQPNDMPYPWRRGTAIPANHLLADVWRTKRPSVGPSSVTFHRSGNTIPCEHAEAKMIGGRVVGILYRGHPHRKEQLRMELVL